MSQPSPFDGLAVMALGASLAVFRRTIAREIEAADDTFDRAHGEDGLAAALGLTGGCVIAIGLVVFLL